jgi:hypothetical protein
MACPNGMDAERAFLDALRQVNTAKVTRQYLDVFDASGSSLPASKPATCRPDPNA